MLRLTCVLVVLFAATSAIALPSYYGLNGLNRVVDAQPLEVNQYSIGLFTHLGISNDVRNAWLPVEGTFEVEDKEYDATGHLAFGYGINQVAEIAGRLSYWWNGYERDLTNEERAAGTGDWEGANAISEGLLAVKLSTNPTNDGQFWIGIMPTVGFGFNNGVDNYVIMEDEGTDGLWWNDDPMFEMRRSMLTTSDVQFGGDALISFNSESGFGAHLNAGFRRYSQTFEFTDTQRDMVTGAILQSEDVDITVDDNVVRMGAALEYKAGMVTPFVEVDYQMFLDRDEEDGDGERYDETAVLDGGFRFVSPYGIALDLTGSMALTEFDPTWSDMGHGIYQATGSVTEEERVARAPFPGGYPAEYGVGLNIIFSSVLLEDPTHGTLSGLVTDIETGEVLEAEVSFPASSVLPQTTVDGYYSVELLAGSVPINADAEGYMPFSETVVIVAGEDHAFDIQMTPVPDNGILTGTVTDGETDEVIAGATVMVEDLPEGMENSVSTNASGVYSIELPEGNWTVKVMAEGYLDVVKVQVMQAEQTTVYDVEMRPELQEGQVLSFNNIYFDSGSSNIKPESFGILDNVAMTLIANEGVAVRIAGHTDSDGSTSYNQGLSERRAEAVRDYLVNKGVAVGRLSTIGYGEEQPVVPNTSAANKAQNRRIEFIILGQAI